MSHSPLHLIWFRNDLRLNDNPALFNAAKAGSVVGVFFICEKQWQEHNDSPAKLGLIADRLREFSKELKQKNIPLKIIAVDYFTEIPGKLTQFCKKHAIHDLWFNNEYPLNEKKRDDQTEQELKKISVTSHRFNGDVILPPGSVLNNSGSMFQVFTPFSNAWRLRANPEILTAFKPPRKQSELAIESDEIPQFGGEYRTDLWQVTTKSIHSRLHKFVERSEQSYKELRDFPAINATSTLSPYLTIGAVGIRECIQVLIETNSDEAFHRQWLTELIWREFYRHLIATNPRLSQGLCFKPVADNLQWQVNQSNFQRWCDGKTGFPIVDAGMRQLKQTGWMHNRVRMITAAFLTKLLRIDWRLGEAHFMQHLMDGDFASNNGGWQWSASVGADSVPYFRIFNPYRQAEKFDPQGNYVRKFVPELSSINDKKIHQPSTLSCETLGYPNPMIDYASERKKTLEIWSEFLNTAR
ncbi:cryptochrome/photolyase family protein [Sessilibacter corallicola]|uniref:Deoxyribodipyrimidine photo-lyase n=1 Tax=Sessilibacter corallicola TaxID=2904075 RepID=A0ABQ0A8R1_9GAMM